MYGFMIVAKVNHGRILFCCQLCIKLLLDKPSRRINRKVFCRRQRSNGLVT